MAQPENFILERNAPNLNILAKAMPQLSAPLFKSLLKLTADIISKNPVPSEALEKIAKGGSTEHLEQILGGLLTFIQSLLRHRPDTVKENDLRHCLENLKFSEECTSEFFHFYNENKNQLYASRCNKWNSIYILQLKKLDWRVDISISSSYLNKNLDTIIILQMAFSNGERKSFELSLSKFHLLRLHVASMLKEMQAAEKKGGLKLL